MSLAQVFKDIWTHLYVFILGVEFLFLILIFFTSSLPTKVKKAPLSFRQKTEVPYILLSDSSSAQVVADIRTNLLILIILLSSGKVKGVGRCV